MPFSAAYIRLVADVLSRVPQSAIPTTQRMRKPSTCLAEVLWPVLQVCAATCSPLLTQPLPLGIALERHASQLPPRYLAIRVWCGIPMAPSGTDT
ncbi:hypothetical protein V2G26_017678 [Clonostachys chloroleuca]